MKKMFIWQQLRHMTADWHSGGGLVSIGATADEALRFAFNYLNISEIIEITEEEWFERNAIEPIKIQEISQDTEPYAIVFKDAGCC